MAHSAVCNEGYQLEYQSQIGSTLYPQYPVCSFSAAYAQFKRCLGLLGSHLHIVRVTPLQYRNDHFIICCDIEKALQAGFTGSNIGDVSSVRVEAMDESILVKERMPDTMYIVLHNDQILEISDQGVQVFEYWNKSIFFLIVYIYI